MEMSRFVTANLLMNGLYGEVGAWHEGDLYHALPSAEKAKVGICINIDEFRIQNDLY